MQITKKKVFRIKACLGAYLYVKEENKKEGKKDVIVNFLQLRADNQCTLETENNNVLNKIETGHWERSKNRLTVHLQTSHTSDSTGNLRSTQSLNSHSLKFKIHHNKLRQVSRHNEISFYRV